MNGVLFQNKVQEYLSPSEQPFFLPHNTIFPPPVLPPPPPPPPPPSVSYQSDNTFNKISPSILLIIIILAIIFFISGLLHLLVRFLFRPTNRDPEDLDNVTALQGQLQQLFHLHDSGVDQSYIDTLPVFLYKAIIGLKNPFDCAVCLCEFEADDKLRLLPKCSHAFHLECIDTWLLSHSTCPICRGSLLPEFPYNNNGGCYSPVVLVLESGSESSREFVSGRDLGTSTHTTTITGTGNQIGCLGEDDFGSSRTDCSKKLNEISVKEESGSVPVIEEKVVTVKLGKFRNVDPPTAPVGQGEASNNSNVDARRCFSMGSFEYVMDETSSLQVPIIPQVRKQSSKKPSIPLTPGHRTAMSECDCHSSREGFKGFDTLQIHSGDSNSNRSSITSHKKDSFSFSKIWLRSKKEKPSSSSVASSNSSSKRVFSFRIPLQKEAMSADDFKSKENNNSSRTISEMDVSRWESSASEMGFDEETGSHNSLDSQPSMPSFARRTILWLAGKQNKVVHSSSPNV